MIDQEEESDRTVVARRNLDAAGGHLCAVFEDGQVGIAQPGYDAVVHVEGAQLEGDGGELCGVDLGDEEVRASLRRGRGALRQEGQQHCGQNQETKGRGLHGIAPVGSLRGVMRKVDGYRATNAAQRAGRLRRTEDDCHEDSHFRRVLPCDG